MFLEAHRDLQPDKLDLFQRWNEDTAFRQQIDDLILLYDHQEKLCRNMQERKALEAVFYQKLFRLCERNTALFTPWFFPRYPKNKPLSMLDRPFNMILMLKAIYSTIVLRGSRQTGKSTTFAVDARLCAEIFPRFRQLYVAPHSNPLETFSRKFMEVDKAFIYPVRDSRCKQNMYYRTYPNGSEIDMQRVMTSVVSVRGKSCDKVILDECQLFDPGLEMELLEVMNDSDFKFYAMGGTATTTESLLETRFQEGCQAVWHIQHPDGKTLINCGDPKDVIPYIGPYQMEDPKTKETINPLNGFYRYLNPEGFRERIVSVHVPQILNPDKINSALEWNGIYKSIVRDRSKAIQEKLGIPLEEANREVTKKDLRRICVLSDGPEERKRRCREGYYRTIVSGFDWGGSDYNTMYKTKVSTTVHTILGVSPDDRIHLLHARRHGGMGYSTIMNLIVADHLAYSAGGIACDFGAGQQYHALLRTHPNLDPSRHIIFDYSGPESAICASPKTSEMANMLMLNKTESVSALFMAIIAADPLLLCPSWDEFGDYLEDFLNLYRVLVDSERGQKGRRFVYLRHGSKSDDVVHSMNFAYSLIRLHYNQALIVDNAARALVRGVVSGQQMHTNPWVGALSSYARSNESFD